MPDFDRVIAVFHEASACDPSRRAALLDQACADDRPLRAEVESLLAAEEAAGRRNFLDEPAAVAMGLVDEVEREEPLGEGARIGPSYRIEREIGRGGMGIVYLAEDERLGRKVAIKVLAPALTSDPRHRDRLRQEARAAAALAHPGIATVYALEEIEDRLYLVVEYVRGETLRAEIDRGVTDAAIVIDVGAQLADALAAAHAAGVTHRDLKPENVMREPSGRIRILDFGIARIEPAFCLDAARVTAAGFGTPAYMSPEQLEGTDVDARSDIFALGVLLYELASGRHPFESPTPASTAARVLTAVPRDVRDINPSMPVALARVIARCLEKAKADRYQRASEVAKDLEAMRGLAVPRGPSRQAGERIVVGEALRWWVSHQVIVMALTAVMVWPVALVYGDVTSDWTLALLLSVIATAAINGTLRAHLLFLAAFDVTELRAQLTRSIPWLRQSDALFAFLLLASAVPTARSHVVRSALLAAVAVGWAATSLVIEPATRRAAFPARDEA